KGNFAPYAEGTGPGILFCNRSGYLPAFMVRAIKLDERSGFVYGLLDSNAQMIRRESLLRGFNWEQINLLQLRAERETHGRLIDEFEQLWHTIQHTDVQLPFNNDAASRTLRHRGNRNPELGK